MNGFHRERWIVLDDGQKSGCWARWSSAGLFPVLKCLHTHAD
jgi:hypothetical protein